MINIFYGLECGYSCPHEGVEKDLFSSENESEPVW